MTLSYNAVHHLIHQVPEKYLKKYDVEPIHNYDPDRRESFENLETGSYNAYYEKYSRIGTINSQDMRKYYLANLNCLDDQIGRVLSTLDDSGLADNTLVIFSSDNGGSPITGASNAPLTGANYSLYEGGIRVPMMVRWPGHVRSEEVSDQSEEKPDHAEEIKSLYDEWCRNNLGRY